MGNASYSEYAYFDIQNGLIVSNHPNAVPTIESFSDDWYRCSIVLTTISSSAIGVFISTNGSTISYTGDGTSGVYIFGAQFEQASYATSYIPTSGSAVTRLAETNIQTPPSGIIGQTEGVLYAEIKANETSNASARRVISISDGTNTNRIYISFDDEYNKLNVFIIVDGDVVTTDNVNISDQNSFNKIAVKYKSGESSIYVNGVLKESFTDTFSNGNFTTLKFQNRGSGNFFTGNVKDIKVYNTALSDSELAALTQV